MNRYLVRKLVDGPYLNSPPQWVEVGFVDADSEQAAAVEAMFSIGSSKITIEAV